MSPQHNSLYADVIADTEAHHAYLHVTRGVLTGCPDDEDFIAAKARLDESGIAYLCNPDRIRPRPLFMMTGRILVGLPEIESYIASVRAGAVS